MRKKILYILFGFVVGFAAASAFSISELVAESASWSQGSAFKESVMTPAVPASYGELKAVYGLTMYFEGENGNIYIVEPRNSKELKSEVMVIQRS